MCRSSKVTPRFTGRRQSRASGLVAASVVRRLNELPPGVRHIEQVVEPAAFLNELTAHGFDVTLSDITQRDAHYDAE